jgi:hypothetical protein
MRALGCTTQDRVRLLLVPGLVALLGLACGAPKADRQAALASRRDAEFAELSGQAGMVTPPYHRPKESEPPPVSP